MQILFNKEKEIEEEKKDLGQKGKEEWKNKPEKEKEEKRVFAKVVKSGKFLPNWGGINSANNHLEKYHIHIFREYHLKVGLAQGR